MSVYIQLLHGRQDPDQDMPDWGFAGPRLGPFVAVRVVYMTEVFCIDQTGESLNLRLVGDLLLWEGAYYGDFEIISDG